MNLTTPELERLCLIHRYLHYVECMPVIGDQEYDTMEKKLLSREDLGAGSIMRECGSDLRESYSDEIIRAANGFSC